MTKKEFKEKYTEVQSLQGENGNYNFDRYMLGLYNGMEMIIALYENREPNYRSAHEINFLNDKQDNLQQRINKAIIEIDTISVDDLDNAEIMYQKINNIKSILQGRK